MNLINDLDILHMELSQLSHALIEVIQASNARELLPVCRDNLIRAINKFLAHAISMAEGDIKDPVTGYRYQRTDFRDIRQPDFRVKQLIGSSSALTSACSKFLPITKNFKETLNYNTSCSGVTIVHNENNFAESLRDFLSKVVRSFVGDAKKMEEDFSAFSTDWERKLQKIYAKAKEEIFLGELLRGTASHAKEQPEQSQLLEGEKIRRTETRESKKNHHQLTIYAPKYDLFFDKANFQRSLAGKDSTPAQRSSNSFSSKEEFQIPAYAQDDDDQQFSNPTWGILPKATVKQTTCKAENLHMFKSTPAYSDVGFCGREILPSTPTLPTKQVVLIRGFPADDPPSLEKISSVIFGDAIERFQLSKMGYHVSFVHSHVAKRFIERNRRMFVTGESGKHYRAWAQWSPPPYDEVDQTSVLAAINPDVNARRVLIAEAWGFPSNLTRDVIAARLREHLENFDHGLEGMLQSIEYREIRARIVYSSIEHAIKMKEKILKAGAMTVRFGWDSCEREKYPKKYGETGFVGAGGMWGIAADKGIW
ncbi:hypothetical protein RUND412_011040 [Rhizina undulata]